MGTDSAVRLTVSAVRQRIYEATHSGKHSSGSIAGQIFHRVAACALSNDHPAYWQANLTDEFDVEEWILLLYDYVVGPDLTRFHSALRDSGEDVLTLWSGVRSFARWFCELLRESVSNGAIAYDRATEQWLENQPLFHSEYEVEACFQRPEWSRPVVVVGRIDQLIRAAANRCCIVELKLGEGSLEADMVQACLYYELLGEERGSASVVRFGQAQTPEETVLSGEWIQQEWAQLLNLIGAMAGVVPHMTSRQPVSGEEGSRWPKPPTEEEVALGKKLVRALREFGADAQLIDQPLVGPSFVRFLVEPGRGVSTSKIEKRGADFQVRLQLEQEPVISRVDGHIAIDVQRPEREFVPFVDAARWITARQSDKGNAVVPIGIDLRGDIHGLDLARECAHLLVAGAPGSGKSEWLRTAIASLIVTNSPDTLRFVLIDPKKVSFAGLEESPFLWREDALVDSPDTAVLCLMEDLVEEMSKRYVKLKSALADDLDSYYQKTGEIIPRIVCFVDEFAELLIGGGRLQRDEFERSFIRIAQKGRAAGVHLILATQRPSRQIVSGVLKANLPGKIAFRVSNRTDSNVILDRGGAQNLLNKGDLLYSFGGEPLRLQALSLGEAERQTIFHGEGFALEEMSKDSEPHSSAA